MQQGSSVSFRSALGLPGSRLWTLESFFTWALLSEKEGVRGPYDKDPTLFRVLLYWGCPIFFAAVQESA